MMYIEIFEGDLRSHDLGLLIYVRYGVMKISYLHLKQLS